MALVTSTFSIHAEDTRVEGCALLPENLSHRSLIITYFKARRQVLGWQESWGRRNACHLACIFLGLGTVGESNVSGLAPFLQVFPGGCLCYEWQALP